MRSLALLWLTIVAFALCVAPLPACHPPMEPRGSIDKPAVAPEVATAFASARVALGLLDAAETYHLDSLAHPTDAELKASSDRVARLVAVRELLERVRQHLAGEVKPDLHQALSDLELLVASARSSGLKIPPEVAASLAAARQVLP